MFLALPESRGSRVVLEQLNKLCVNGAKRNSTLVNCERRKRELPKQTNTGAKRSVATVSKERSDERSSTERSSEVLHVSRARARGREIAGRKPSSAVLTVRIGSEGWQSS